MASCNQALTARSLQHFQTRPATSSRSARRNWPGGVSAGTMAMLRCWCSAAAAGLSTCRRIVRLSGRVRQSVTTSTSACERRRAAHPFGTDAVGRDILARTIYGGQISLIIGAGCGGRGAGGRRGDRRALRLLRWLGGQPADALHRGDAEHPPALPAHHRCQVPGRQGRQLSASSGASSAAAWWSSSSSSA